MNLNEGTTVEDIATNPELVKELELISANGNISRLISDVRQLNRPAGKIQGILRDKSNDKLIIKEKLVDVVSTLVKTEFTEEALQDLYTTYGEDIYKVLAKFLNDEINEELNVRLFDFLDMHSKIGLELAMNPSETKVTANVIVNIKTKINTEIVRIAKLNKRPIRGFAIVSSNIASAMTVDGFKNISDTAFNSFSNTYIGTIGSIDYYMNPFHTDDVDLVYVGIKGNGYSGGSLYYLPYNTSFLFSTDSESGNKNLHSLDRSNIALNPFDLSTGNNDSTFLTKFNIDISGFEY